MTNKRNKILIYCDYGCADISQLKSELEQYFVPQNIVIEDVDASAIIKDNALNDSVLAFFIGGGASTPYRKKLQGLGNQKIIDYVQNGGIYFGICAGAYYACSKIEFETDIAQINLKRDGIGLIDTTAIGTLYKEFGINPYSLDASSAFVANISYDAGSKTCGVYYHGGGYFDCLQDKCCKVLGYYDDLSNPLPAIIAKKYGKGLVIASGVHFEDSGKNYALRLHEQKIDYIYAQDIANKLISQEEFRKDLQQKLFLLLQQN